MIQHETHSTCALHVINRRQQGASLFVALIALIVMTLSGLALIRSVDTATLVSGNLAFKEAAVSVADRGTSAAVNFLNTTATVSNADANLPAGCAPQTCQYYSEAQSSSENTKGVPLINWGSTNIPSVDQDGFKYQFVIERLCREGGSVVLGATPRAESMKDCFANAIDGLNSNLQQSQGSQSVKAAELGIVYRVTTRVSGPQNTETIVQTLLSR